MDITELKDREISNDSRLENIYSQFRELLNELKKKPLPESFVKCINGNITQINTSGLTGNDLRKFIKQQQSVILKQLEKELKIVPKNYYRNLWLVLGMSAFGLPIGVAFGMSMDNMGLLGTGLPIGMAIGFAVGSAMDKKALAAGRQLHIEIKY